MSHHPPYVVGITGGSASGKTLFLNLLMKKFSSTELCILSQDNYYKDRQTQHIDTQGVQNFDMPDSIDQEAFAHDLSQLRQNIKVTKQEYTFNNPNVTPKILEFKPAPLIVVEGIFVFHTPDVRKQIDLKVFVDSKDHLMLKRRITRDAVERGYDLDDVLYRFEHHVMPSYNEYIKPYKNTSDIIVPNNEGPLDKSVGVLSSYLRGKID